MLYLILFVEEEENKFKWFRNNQEVKMWLKETKKEEDDNVLILEQNDVDELQISAFCGFHYLESINVSETKNILYNVNEILWNMMNDFKNGCTTSYGEPESNISVIEYDDKNQILINFRIIKVRDEEYNRNYFSIEVILSTDFDVYDLNNDNFYYTDTDSLSELETLISELLEKDWRKIYEIN